MSGPRYFEDWRAGEVLDFGRYDVTAEEIKAFARQYDPQSFHLDESAAKESIFGGLVASGWHSCAMLMRMIADTPAFIGHNIASPGFDDLEWRHPVRPGDVLTGRCKVLDTRRSQSRPNRGLVWYRQSLLNQDGDIVLSMKSLVLYWRRGATAATAAAAAGGGE